MTEPAPDYRTATTVAQRVALDFLERLPTRAAALAKPRDPASDVAEGLGLEAAIEFFRERLEPGLSGSNGPRYYGFVTGGASPAGLAGDWLAAAYNQNVSNDVGSSAAMIERQVAARFAQLFGLAPEMRGHFTSGATASNTVALATARQTLHQRLGIDSADTGQHAAPPVRVLGGAPHSSIAKAMAILGMGRAQLQVVGTLSGRSAVDPAALATALRENPGPTIVVASTGEVNTGDFDDLVQVAELCRRHGAWLHVDGAFGLFAALSPRHAAHTAGVEHADSVTVDLHKWLNVPYDSALVYTREPAMQRQVFRASAAYLGDSDDPLHFTPENSRRFRALPAWMVLAAHGPDGIAEAVQRCCALAGRLGEGIAATPGLELLDSVRLNIICFALADRSKEARDAFLARTTADGRAFFTPTSFGGRPAVRVAVSNWSTRAADIDTTLAAIRAALG